jgi:hypothetical protein
MPLIILPIGDDQQCDEGEQAGNLNCISHSNHSLIIAMSFAKRTPEGSMNPPMHRTPAKANAPGCKNPQRDVDQKCNRNNKTDNVIDERHRTGREG